MTLHQTKTIQEHYDRMKTGKMRKAESLSLLYEAAHAEGSAVLADLMRRAAEHCPICGNPVNRARKRRGG